MLTPSWAVANICVPEPTEKLKVVGVDDDDTLNVREGYTTNYKVVTELFPKQDSIRFKDVVYQSEDCSLLCDDFIYLIENEKNNEAIEIQKKIIQESCKNNSKIWYLISVPDGKEGWASSKYLEGYTDLKPSERAPKNGETASNEIIEHVVVKGDTAYAISKKYNISLDDLAKRNNLDASFALELGQKLVISNKITQAKEIVELPKRGNVEAVETSKEVITKSEADQTPIAKSENSNGIKSNVKTVKHKSFEKFGNTFAGTFSFKEACRQDPNIFNNDFLPEHLCYKSVSGTITFDGISNLSNLSKARANFLIDLKDWPLKLEVENIKMQLSRSKSTVSIKGGSSSCKNSFAISQVVDGFQKLKGSVSVVVRKTKIAKNVFKNCNKIPIYFSVDYRQPEYINSLLIVPIQAVVGSEKVFKSKFVRSPEFSRKKFQKILKATGYYNGRTDGYWDQKLVQSTNLAILENFQQIVLTSSHSKEEMWRAWGNEGVELGYLFTDEFREKFDYEFAVASAERKQKEKLIQQEEAAKERERKKREAQEQKLFCENTQNSDFWKRFSFLREKPINILGVDMSMSLGEIRKVLECKNYRCQYETNMSGAKLLVCSEKKAQITISSTNLSFNCASLNVCGLNLEEVGQKLIDAGKIFAMEPSIDFNSEVNLQTTKYCGRGRAGDTLCVEQSTFVTLNSIENALLGGGEITTILNKSNLGKAKPNFD